MEIFGRRSSASLVGALDEGTSEERGKTVGRRGVSDVNVLRMSVCDFDERRHGGCTSWERP